MKQMTRKDVFDTCCVKSLAAVAHSFWSISFELSLNFTKLALQRPSKIKINGSEYPPDHSQSLLRAGNTACFLKETLNLISPLVHPPVSFLRLIVDAVMMFQVLLHPFLALWSFEFRAVGLVQWCVTGMSKFWNSLFVFWQKNWSSLWERPTMMMFGIIIDLFKYGFCRLWLHADKETRILFF